MPTSLPTDLTADDLDGIIEYLLSVHRPERYHQDDLTWTLPFLGFVEELLAANPHLMPEGS